MDISVNTIRNISKYFLMVLMFGVLTQCAEEIDEWKPQAENQVITEYIESNPEFSEFAGMIDTTGVRNLLRVRGPFTVFVPTNEAMKTFYGEKGISSYKELPYEYIEELVYNHIFSTTISIGDIGIGALPEKNAAGNFISSDRLGSEVILNKKARVIDEETTSNGVVAYIDVVLDLIDASVYDIMGNIPQFSIFYEGLQRTKLFDTLGTIDFQYGEYSIRTYFTILGVPDSVYQRAGINSVDDLIDEFSTTDDITNPEDSFYIYMEYHCLAEGYYLTDLVQEKVYPSISNNSYVNIQVLDDFMINEDTSGNYATFYVEESNIPAKNGVIHTINSILPHTEARPAAVIHEVTDYFDIKREPGYGKYYQRYYDGQNTFKDVKWGADYLMYYYKEGQNIMNNDALAVQGHFWIEITTPKVMKGKYMMQSFWFGGGVAGASSMDWYIDGELVNNVLMEDGVWGGTPVDIAEVEFLETKNHTIKIASVVPGNIWWDRLIFSPIN